jgi:hypothetical protein
MQPTDKPTNRPTNRPPQVRVYVNGLLAGFSPVFYTMYTVRRRDDRAAVWLK